MRNIKVNICNESGTKSSTTINYSICEAYYKVACGLSGMPKDIDISINCHETIDDYVTGVRNCAQSYVNELLHSALSLGFLGISQYHIESNMLDYAINNQGY